MDRDSDLRTANALIENALLDLIGFVSQTSQGTGSGASSSSAGVGVGSGPTSSVSAGTRANARSNGIGNSTASLSTNHQVDPDQVREISFACRLHPSILIECSSWSARSAFLSPARDQYCKKSKI